MDRMEVHAMHCRAARSTVSLLALAGIALAVPGEGRASEAAWVGSPSSPSPIPRGAREGRRADVSLAVGWRSYAPRSELLGGLWVSLPLDGWTSREPSREGRKAKRETSEPLPGAPLRGEATRRVATKPGGERKPPSGAAGPMERRADPRDPAPGSPASSTSPARALPPSAAPVAAPGERHLARLLAIPWPALSAAAREVRARRGRALDERGLAERSARARRSAALPELRLRAMRVATESSALAPTSYDPLRQTASGGTSTWLEARATWQLDRVLFASEELPLARLARDLDEARAKEEARLVELVQGWQAAVAERLDPSASFRECRAAFLRELQHTAELDRLTGGWFSAERARAPALPEPDCLAVAERVAP